jgi:hypothetical protein
MWDNLTRTTIFWSSYVYNYWLQYFNQKLVLNDEYLINILDIYNQENKFESNPPNLDMKIKLEFIKNILSNIEKSVSEFELAFKDLTTSWDHTPILIRSLLFTYYIERNILFEIDNKSPIVDQLSKKYFKMCDKYFDPKSVSTMHAVIYKFENKLIKP